jgi:hypothetical protein
MSQRRAPMRPCTYPARPLNGGPLDRALSKSGPWHYEPKYNGWRALVHAPTGTMFNRHGQRLSIEKEFGFAVALAVDCVRPHRTRRDMPDILRSFWHPVNMKYRSPILAWFAQILLAGAVFAQPEAGPENGGLQLRLVVLPHFQAGKAGYEVRLDLINATKEDIRLRAGWLNENDKGDVKDYIKAITSIETHPPIAPWAGQVVMPHRESKESQTAISRAIYERYADSQEMTPGEIGRVNGGMSVFPETRR